MVLLQRHWRWKHENKTFKQYNFFNIQIHVYPWFQFDCMFVRMLKCFLVCLECYRPTREFFTHIETSPLSVKGCKFWPILSPSGHWKVRVSLACHSYCNTGRPFIMVFSNDSCYSHIECLVGDQLSLPVSKTYVCSGLDLNKQLFAFAAKTRINCPTMATFQFLSTRHFGYFCHLYMLPMKIVLKKHHYIMLPRMQLLHIHHALKEYTSQNFRK